MIFNTASAVSKLVLRVSHSALTMAMICAPWASQNALIAASAPCTSGWMTPMAALNAAWTSPQNALTVAMICAPWSAQNC